MPVRPFSLFKLDSKERYLLIFKLTLLLVVKCSIKGAQNLREAEHRQIRMPWPTDANFTTDRTPNYVYFK